MDYRIFMAMVEKVGHDKRGTPIYKRDEYGNELLRDDDIIELDETAAGTRTATSVTKVKILDDQTL